MSLTSLFPDAESQKVATTIIGLVSIFSAVLITMNQYVKSQQMMEAHRAAGLAYGKLHRIIMNEMALRRDQRQNALEFLKLVRNEQDRLENSSPSILPSIIRRFNRQFADRDIEKPEIAGDLDETNVNQSSKKRSKIPETLRGATKPLLAEGAAFFKQKVSPISAVARPTRIINARLPATDADLQIDSSHNSLSVDSRPPILNPHRSKTEDSIPEHIIVEGNQSPARYSSPPILRR